MLRELYIRNYALIDELRVELGPGLNILTGETGAGKSIVIGALSLLLGERSDPNLIRTKAPYLEVAGAFEPDTISAATLADYGFDTQEELIIQRRVERSGRSQVHLNRAPAPLATLRRMGEDLVDIHGQHEHQSLLKVALHLDLLDEFANLTKLRAEVRGLHSRKQELSRELATLEADLKRRISQRELYQFQSSEIDEAGLEPDEEDRLKEEKGLLETSERRYILSQELKELLSEKEESALAILAQAEARLSELARLDPKLKNELISLKEASTQLEELWRQTLSYQERIDFTPERLETINQRLWQLDRLKRKYDRSIPEILNYRDELVKTLATLEIDESRLEGLKSEISQVEAALATAADELSQARKGSKGRFEELMSGELSGLGMGQARFEVVLKRRDEIGEVGWDEAEFCFSANPGEPPRPLRQIASGGEMSRIMLALKGILSQVDRVPILVFDEIDVGIGGVVAEVVGRRLSELARSRQVICITHLPQIAKYAQTHIRVFKEVKGGRTYTRVEKLSETERVSELARMLGGEAITETTLRHARELLKDVRG